MSRQPTMSLEYAFSDLVAQLKLAQHVRDVTELDQGAVLVKLSQPTFEEEMLVYLVAGELSVGFIKNALNNNSQRDMYTLIIVAFDRLTQGDGVLFPSDALRLLQQAYGGVVYAYDIDRYGRTVFFTLQPQERGAALRGDPLDFAELCGDYATFNNKYLRGVRKVANFNRQEQYARKNDGPRMVSDELQAYYDLLDIPLDSTEDDVKRAYRRQARLHHPDTDHSPDATAKMQAINAAYERILKELSAVEAR